MADFDLSLDPNFRQSLNAEQLQTLERIEQLATLDPEITARLARTLDRLQKTLPYQQLKRPETRNDPPANPDLSEAERAVREDFITQELSALLTLAGQLNQAFEANRPRAVADQRFKEQLRNQFK